MHKRTINQSFISNCILNTIPLNSLMRQNGHITIICTLCVFCVSTKMSTFSYVDQW